MSGPRLTPRCSLPSWVHRAPPWFYLLHLPGAVFPWFFAVLAALRGANRFYLSWIAAVIVPAIVARYAMGNFLGSSFLAVAAAVVISLLIHAFTRSMTLRLLATALLMVLVVYVPLQRFERDSARRFIADTYAPWVVGEAGQLRTMVEDTLHREPAIEKIGAAVGWRPERDLDRILADVIEHARSAGSLAGARASS